MEVLLRKLGIREAMFELQFTGSGRTVFAEELKGHSSRDPESGVDLQGLC